MIGEKFTDLSPSGPKNENAEEKPEVDIITLSYEITVSIRRNIRLNYTVYAYL